MKKYWFLIVLIVYVVSFGAQLWLEYTNKADSIGLWYTLFSAGIYTVAIMLGILAINFIVTIIRH
jgi:hypothetical protein